MFETATDNRTRDAYRAAHEARGRVFAELWQMIAGRR